MNETIQYIDFKNYTINEINKIYPNISVRLEKSIYKYAKERYDAVYKEEPIDEKIIKIFLNFYKQCYIRTVYNLKYNKNKEYLLKNLEKNSFTDLAEVPRDVLDPEKWDKLYKIRTDDLTSKRKKGLIKCGKCKSWFTTHTESQRASADESMCVMVSCLDCGNNFKFS